MRLLLCAVAAAATVVIAGCSVPECAYGDHSSSECRVAAENHYARLVTSGGVELKFVLPEAADAPGWEALGLLELRDGVVRARPAGLGDFAIAIDPGETAASEMELLLDNVAADAVVTVGPPGAEAAVLFDGDGIRRTVTVPLDEGVVRVRGERACGGSYHLVAAGDVQTGPIQFERILQDLHDEVARADELGEPLLGLVLLGDLAEAPSEEELRHVEAILERSPVPVAVTPGNHDVHGNEVALFNRVYGPGNYVFDICRTRVVVMDSGGADLAPSIEGRLPELLDKGGADFLVGATHYPPYAGRTGNGMRDADAAWYPLSELVRNEADLMLAGHYHNWREFPAVQVGDGQLHEIISGTLGASQGAGTPHFGVTRLRFSDDGIDSCFVEMSEPGRAPGDHGHGTLQIRFCEDD